MALNLTLAVFGGPQPEIGDPWRKVFGPAGGRIGRALDCDWVLSNRHISRHHATVSCVGGVFYIEAIGQNGLAVNDSQSRLPRRRPRALNDGDRLFLDQYEIRVAISDDSEAAMRNDAAVILDADALALPSPESEPVWEHSFSLADHLEMPSITTSLAATVPNGLENTGATNPYVSVRTRPGRRVAWLVDSLFPTTVLRAPAPALDAGFEEAAFLKGMGLRPENIPSGSATAFGQIVRAVLQGLIDVLRARAELRDQLHLPPAQARTSRNNPLLSAINLEEALATLLRTPAEGCMTPLEAFEEAFSDIRFHQLAMLAGMRAGFQSVTNCFDPESLMEQSDRLSGPRIPRFGAKGRYWERYLDLFEQIATNPDAGFRRAYDEEFSHAYERQLEDLKRNCGKQSDEPR